MNNSSVTSWHTTGATTFSGGADVLNNTASGLIATNSGGVATSFDFGAGSDTFTNAGLLAVGEPLPGAATLTITGLETFNNSGRIVLGWNGASTSAPVTDDETDDALVASGTAFTGSGGSQLLIDAFLGEPDESDTMTVGAIAGSTVIHVNDTNSAGAGAFHSILVVNGASSTASAFTLGNGPVIEKGLVNYQLELDSAAGDWYLTGLPDIGTVQASRILSGVQQLWHETSLIDHTGLLRWSHGDGTVLPAQDTALGGPVSLWGRVLIGNNDRDGVVSFTTCCTTHSFDTSYEQIFGGLQAGVDMLSRGSMWSWSLGVFGGYAYGDSEFNGSTAATDLDAWHIGGIASMMNGPFFFDMLGKVDFFDGTFISPAPEMIVPISGSAIGFQGNAGFTWENERFFVQPLATLAYVSTQIDSVVVLGGALDFVDDNSFRGRLAARLGTELATGGEIVVRPFVQAGVWKEFAGENILLVTSGPTTIGFVDAPLDVWGEFSAGLDLLERNGLSAFVKGEYITGEHYDGIGVRAGLRFVFGQGAAP